MVASVSSLALGLAVGLGAVPALAASQLKIDSREGILDAARVLAGEAMAHYKGDERGGIPGILPPIRAGGQENYYWWSGSWLMSNLIDYAQLTGDDQYTIRVREGVLHQAGENADYQPRNWTAQMGNDDQCSWASTALRAAELGFLNPPDGQPGWLELAERVFAIQAHPSRHDDQCGGGLRWQIAPTNAGYEFKNSGFDPCVFLSFLRPCPAAGPATVTVGISAWRRLRERWFGSSLVR